MANQRLSLTRDQFASFLSDFEQIKQFERLFANTNAMSISIDDVVLSSGNAGASATDALAQIVGLSETLNKEQSPATTSQIAVIETKIDGLSLAPPPLDEIAIRALTPALTAPVTKTADFTVAYNETWIINNKSGSTCVVTLPSAATNVGRYLTFQNNQDQNLDSASSNVVPQGGGAAGTSILLNVSGNWATLVSNGTNWVIMQAASFNTLLY
jgi:hypothetical protein